jgi:hypothetical protein
MASTVLTDAKLYVSEFDLSGYMNAVNLEFAAEMLDETTFGQTTRVHTGGVKSVVAGAEGFWQAVPDAALFARIGVQNAPVTISPTGAADGGLAYLFRAIHAEYAPGGSHGELLGFSTSMEGSDGAPLVRGLVLQPAGSETETGTGTGRQLGAVAAGKTLYASLHVLSASSGDTLDVIVQSDDNSDFSSPTTRLTFPQASAVGSGWQTLAGPVTDTWYRVSFTIAGDGDPDFSFVVAVGIA